jgi:hypothetical protein
MIEENKNIINFIKKLNEKQLKALAAVQYIMLKRTGVSDEQFMVLYNSLFKELGLTK